MNILGDILGSISILSLILSLLSFVAVIFRPKQIQEYNDKYDWIIFLLYGIALLACSVFFGLLYQVVSHL